MKQRFTEVARVRRVEGSGEWSLLIDHDAIRNLIGAKITGEVKKTNESSDKFQIKLEINAINTPLPRRR